MCALATLLMGVSVLFGWHFKILILKTFVPGLVTMNPMTAACLISSSVAIFLLAKGGEKYKAWINLIASALILIGVLKIGDLLEWWHCLPDVWIYGERVNEQIFNGRPNRLAPNTALNFTMQGSALLLRNIGRNRGSIPSQLLLSIQGFTSLVAVLGYFYGARSINDFGSYSPMALPTGIGFLLLTVGTLCALPDRGIMKVLVNQGDAGKTNQRLLLSGLLAPLLLGWFTIWGQRAGFYTPLLSVAVFCMTATVCFIALTLWHGARLIETQNRQNRQESQLRDSEERFKFLAESAFEGLVISVDGIIQDANSQFTRMMGYSLDEVIGKPNAAFVAPEEQERVTQQVTANSDNIYRVVGIRKDGSRVELELTPRPMRIGGKNGRVTAVRDITQRRQMELMKDEFVSVVSHELRTPLTSIHGALGLMANGVAGPLSEPAQAMVDVAVRNTKRLLVLINDLLDIQKIEAGEMDFRRVEVDLNSLIENTLQSMYSYSQSLEVRFEFEGTEHKIRVCSDPDRLGQVLTNLLSNAAKFSPSHGRVQVTLRETGVSNSGDPSQALITVSDQGPGIPIEFQDRVFQKFAQADSSTTRQVNGTGLGLSICKTVIDKLGGSIGFHSEKGKGTTFYFQLPLKQE